MTTHPSSIPPPVESGLKGFLRWTEKRQEKTSEEGTREKKKTEVMLRMTCVYETMSLKKQNEKIQRRWEGGGGSSCWTCLLPLHGHVNEQRWIQIKKPGVLFIRGSVGMRKRRGTRVSLFRFRYLKLDSVEEALTRSSIRFTRLTCEMISSELFFLSRGLALVVIYKRTEQHG